jgi:hypothetical protein
MTVRTSQDGDWSFRKTRMGSTSGSTSDETTQDERHGNKASLPSTGWISIW